MTDLKKMIFERSSGPLEPVCIVIIVRIKINSAYVIKCNFLGKLRGRTSLKSFVVRGLKWQEIDWKIVSPYINSTTTIFYYINPVQIITERHYHYLETSSDSTL